MPVAVLVGALDEVLVGALSETEELSRGTSDFCAHPLKADAHIAALRMIADNFLNFIIAVLSGIKSGLIIAAKVYHTVMRRAVLFV